MLPSRQQHPLRLTEGQADRLESVLKHRGQTKQAFCLTAVMRAVEEAEAEMRVRTEEKIQRRRDVKDKRAGNEPVGLGLGLKMRPSNDGERAIANANTQSAPPVIVNVGGTQTQGNRSLIEGLASHIASGPEYSKGERLRAAIDVLRSVSGDQEEREALANQLDVAVAAATAKGKQQAAPPGGGVVRMTRAAFDSLSDFLK